MTTEQEEVQNRGTFGAWLVRERSTKSSKHPKFTQESLAAALLAEAADKRIKDPGVSVKAVGKWEIGACRPGPTPRNILAKVLGSTREDIDRLLVIDAQDSAKDARAEVRALELRVAECERLVGQARAEADELRVALTRRFTSPENQAWLKMERQRELSKRTNRAEACLTLQARRLAEASGGRGDETIEALLAVVATACAAEDGGAAFASALRTFRTVDDMAARGAALNAFAASASAAHGLITRTIARAQAKQPAWPRGRRVTLTSPYAVPREPTPEEELLDRASTVWKREAAAAFREFEANMTWLLSNPGSLDWGAPAQPPAAAPSPKATE